MTATAEKLRASRALSVDQGEFDFLCPYRAALLTPRQAAVTMGRELSFVYTMIEAGKLDAFAVRDRVKSRYTITKRSVLLLMAEQALFTPNDLLPRLAEVAATLSGAQYQTFLRLAGERRGASPRS
jgi:hypothetical protein